MQSEEARAALRKALEQDEDLAARFAAATNDDELRALVEDLGIEWSAELDDMAAEAAGTEVSDAELATVAGGYTFPRTDWIYCDNPWTNYWCTLRC